MGHRITFDCPIGEESEIGAFMGRQLENDEGEAELEDDLQGDDAIEGIVITLFIRGEETRDQKQGHEAGKSLPEARQNGKKNGAVQADPVFQQVHHGRVPAIFASQRAVHHIRRCFFFLDVQLSLFRMPEGRERCVWVFSGSPQVFEEKDTNARDSALSAPCV